MGRPTARRLGSPQTRRRVLLVLQVAVPLLILTVLARRFGSDAFRPALAVLSPAPLAAALLLGAVAVGAQAARWRVVLRGAGLPLGPGEAVTEYYRACALNTVLPGGVAGDALRAWRQRTGAPRGWRPGAVSVVGERAAGLSALLAVSAVVLLTVAPPLAHPLAPAAVAAVTAVVALLVAWPSLRRLAVREQAIVWAWSALSVAALLALAFVAAAAVGVPADSGTVGVLGVALLAGTAIPFNVGGWGPREASGAIAAAMVGLSPAVGVSVAAGYGLLATVSVLPGFLLVGLDRPDRALRRRPEHLELPSPVLPEQASVR